MSSDSRPVRSEQAEQTRARILVAANTELAQRGYAGASLANIAHRASVSKATILVYFRTKEELYWAVAEQQIVRTRLVAFDGDDPAAWVLGIFERDIEQPEWTRFRVWEGLAWQYQPELMRPPSALRQAALRQRVERVAELQAQSQLPRVFDAPQFALFLHILGSYPHTLPQIAYMTAGAFPTEPLFRKRFATFVRGLMTLLMTPALEPTALATRSIKPRIPGRLVRTGPRVDSEAGDLIAGRGSASIKAKILDAARVEFIKDGYEGASIASIAARAEVSKGTVTYCFQSKETLFAAVWDDQLARVGANLETGKDAADVPLSLIDDRSVERDWLRLQLWEGLSCGNSPARIHGLDSRVNNWRMRKRHVGRDQRLGLLPDWLESAQMAFFLYMLGIYPHIFPYAAYSATGHYPNHLAFRTKYRSFVTTLLDMVQNGARGAAAGLETGGVRGA